MKKTIKKYIAIFLIVAVPLQVQATIANSVGFGIATTGALGVMMGVATGVTIAATGGLALGVLGAAIYFAPDGTIPTPSNAVLMVSLSPNNSKMKTPAGWSSPTSPPTTSATTGTLYTTPNITDNPSSSAETSCQAYVNFVRLSNPAHVYKGVALVGTDLRCQTINTTAGCNPCNIAFISSKPACPTGYIASGSSCILQTASAVIKPVQNTQEIKRVGNTFVQDPQANPADIAPTSKVNVQPSTVTVNGADGSKSVTQINPDGSVTVTNTAPKPNSPNSSQSIANFGVPDANGDVPLTGKSDSEIAGQGSAVGGAVSTPLDISALNKETTQAAISGKLTTTNDTLTGIKDSLTGSVTPPTDFAANETSLTTEITKTTDKIAEYGTSSVFDSLETALHSAVGAFNPSFPSATCAPITGSVHGNPVSIDLCPSVEKINALLGWLLNLFTAYLIYGMLFRRED